MLTEQDEIFELEREGKLLGWITSSGDLIPNIRGGATEEEDEDEDEEEDGSEEDEDEDEDEEDEDEDEDEDVDDDEPSISQNQMRRIASKEKKDGRRSGRNSVLRALGLASVEEGIKKLSSGKTKPKGGSEGESSGQEQEDPEKVKRQAKLEGKAMRKLVAAGAPDKDKTLEGIMSMLDLEFDELTDDDDITTAVDSLKEEMPALFGTGTAKRKTKPKGVGEAGGPPARRKKAAEGEGKALFESRHSVKK